jgi:FkbM family methyltransferase
MGGTDKPMSDFPNGNAPYARGTALSNAGENAGSLPMLYRLAKHVNRVGRRLGFEVRRFHAPTERGFENWWAYASLLETAWRRRSGPPAELESGFVEYCIAHHAESAAQVFQDLLVLSVLGEKRGGFFVEFGATDGISFNNTYLLERKYGWQGILAEPARGWQKALRQNRHAAIETRCVWSRSGDTLQFNEPYAGELSTVDEYSRRDRYARQRSAGKHYRVETISLNDLLKRHEAPHQIDYLSIDTEGSEFNILSHFDFTAYEIALITVEHAYVTRDRENIAALMQRHGFKRILEHYSLFDDWYVNRHLVNADRSS